MKINIEDKRKTGIYRIRNLLTDDIYVGSASLSFHARYRCHLTTLNKSKHRNKHLQRAWDKYGGNNFVFELLEYCSPEKCIEKEQFYLDALNPKYNINRRAENCRGIKHSLEFRKKISDRMKGTIPWNKGRKFNEQTRTKMSESRKAGFKRGTVVSWNKGKKVDSPRQIIRNDGKVYPNVTIAARDLKVKENTVVKACTETKFLRKVRGFALAYI